MTVIPTRNLHEKLSTECVKNLCGERAIVVKGIGIKSKIKKMTNFLKKCSP